MKKSNLLFGVLFVLAGTTFLAIALIFDTKLNSLLIGFSGGLIAPGIIEIVKYFYWSSSKNKKRYAERLDNHTIELHDERKEKLRDKSGRYAYLLGLITISISIIVFSVLAQLEMIRNAQLIILYLSGYFIFQYTVGIFIFKHLNNK